jgi:Zn-dependent M28 family amino/carboxypeptidase
MRRLALAALAFAAGAAGCRSGDEKPNDPKSAAAPRAAAKPAPGTITVEPKAFDRDPRFSPNRILASVRFLASDSLEGRLPGAHGGALATEYLASQAKAMGLEPGAADGTYLQAVPLVGIDTQPTSTMSLDAPGKPGRPLRWLEDFVGADETLAATTRFEGPVVFVGYGIVSPEYQWNDYAGTDVRGKVVMILANEPGRSDPNNPLFAGPALTYFGRWTYKFEEAARQGAAGALLIHTDEAAGYAWTVVRSSWGRERPYPKPESHQLSAAAWIQESVASDALARAGLDLASLRAKAEERGFKAIPTDLTAHFDWTAKTREIPTHNVLALLPGSDPARAQEAIVYSAHYDHLGVATPENGDAIYNGAVDNASGCGAVLEIARAFAATTPRPPRSILFAWVTAEEGGLRGSEYLARHSTFPPERIVANLNLDGVPMDGDPTEIVALGRERSTLGPLVARVAASLGLSIAADRDPRQGYFFRSDHFSFAKVGIPSLSINAGTLYFGKPESWGQERYEDYRKNRYHRPSDEFDPSWDGVVPAKLAEFAFLLGLDLARSDAIPTYLPGDEFRAAQPNRGAR